MSRVLHMLRTHWMLFLFCYFPVTQPPKRGALRNKSLRTDKLTLSPLSLTPVLVSHCWWVRQIPWAEQHNFSLIRDPGLAWGNSDTLWRQKEAVRSKGWEVGRDSEGKNLIVEMQLLLKSLDPWVSQELSVLLNPAEPCESGHLSERGTTAWQSSGRWFSAVVLFWRLEPQNTVGWLQRESEPAGDPWRT